MGVETAKVAAGLNIQNFGAIAVVIFFFRALFGVNLKRSTQP